MLSQMGRAIRSTLDDWVGPENMHLVTEVSSRGWALQQLLGRVRIIFYWGYTGDTPGSLSTWLGTRGSLLAVLREP